MERPAYQRTVLVVEDEFYIRMSAVGALEDEGFLVLEAKNSADALNVLSRHSETSILMTDVRMPGFMDGLALVAQVHIDHPEICSIVVSGDASAQQARNAGAFGFVAKPYLMKTMVQAAHDCAAALGGTIYMHLKPSAPPTL
jgi:two-component system, response regulator PdtaR